MASSVSEGGTGYKLDDANETQVVAQGTEGDVADAGCVVVVFMAA